MTAQDEIVSCRDVSTIQKLFPNLFSVILNMHLLFPFRINCINTSNSSHLPVSTRFTISSRKEAEQIFLTPRFWVGLIDLLWQWNEAEVTMYSFQTKPQEAWSHSVYSIMRKTSVSQTSQEEDERQVGRAAPAEPPTKPGPEQSVSQPAGT